mgnify:CR=1 FL=1
MDFIQNIYTVLLKTILSQDYKFLTFKEVVSDKDIPGKKIVLRHDVDKLPLNSLQLAEIENSPGRKATYYFHVVPAS